jgi:hypothetical protein
VGALSFGSQSLATLVGLIYADRTQRFRPNSSCSRVRISTAGGGLAKAITMDHLCLPAVIEMPRKPRPVGPSGSMDSLPATIVMTFTFAAFTQTSQGWSNIRRVPNADVWSPTRIGFWELPIESRQPQPRRSFKRKSKIDDVRAPMMP